MADSSSAVGTSLNSKNKSIHRWLSETVEPDPTQHNEFPTPSEQQDSTASHSHTNSKALDHTLLPNTAYNASNPTSTKPNEDHYTFYIANSASDSQQEEEANYDAFLADPDPEEQRKIMTESHPSSLSLFEHSGSDRKSFRERAKRCLSKFGGNKRKE